VSLFESALWGLLVIFSLVVSALLTMLIRAIAAGRGVLDVPNARSSHVVPTPRGGGVAIVLITTAGLSILATRAAIGWDLLWALAGGGLAVALVGLADDRHPVSAAARLAVHFAAAFWALGWLGGLPALRVGDEVVWPGWAGYLIGALGIVWAINLFNFMDGIDGLATSEAVFIAVGGALLSFVLNGNVVIALPAMIFAAACGGFLLWNWPPARIFLGDVGSGYLGYVIVVLAIAATRNNPVALWVWLILGGAFFVDATVTLARRVLRSERPHEAHRTHAYQWLARRWGSHGKVTLAVLAVNLLWLLPCAVLAACLPGYAAACVLLAFAPLVALAVASGAGRKEARVPGT